MSLIGRLRMMTTLRGSDDDRARLDGVDGDWTEDDDDDADDYEGEAVYDLDYDPTVDPEDHSDEDDDYDHDLCYVCRLAAVEVLWNPPDVPDTQWVTVCDACADLLDAALEADG